MILVALSDRLCERWLMDKIMDCPFCERPLSAEQSRELHKRQVRAGRLRWQGVSKRNLSEEMKRVRRGEKKNGIAT